MSEKLTKNLREFRVGVGLNYPQRSEEGISTWRPVGVQFMNGHDGTWSVTIYLVVGLLIFGWVDHDE